MAITVARYKSSCTRWAEADCGNHPISRAKGGIRTRAVSKRSFIQQNTDSMPAGSRFARQASGPAKESFQAQSAVAPLPFLKVHDGLEQMFLSEVRPERLRHPNFRISRLPEKKIAQPHFAAGANEQVGIGNRRGVEVPADSVFVNFDFAVRARLRDEGPHS